MAKLIDLTGQRFGKLVVMERTDNYITPKGTPIVRWICRCDCGKTVSIRGCSLRAGHSQSCGCLMREKTAELGNMSTHGLSKTRLHKIWRGIKDRCLNTKSKDYPGYGGRGITVCAEWREDFMQFYAWSMTNGYGDDLSIDRIDNDNGYRPENCRWVTRDEQNRNKSNLKYIQINGDTNTLAEWCRQYDLPYHTVHQRIYASHWTPEEALGIAPRKK